MIKNRALTITALGGVVIIFSLVIRGCAGGNEETAQGPSQETATDSATGDHTANSIAALTARYEEVQVDNTALADQLEKSDALIQQQADAIEKLNDKLENVSGIADQADRQAGTLANHLAGYEDRLRSMVDRGDSDSKNPPDQHQVVPGSDDSSAFLLNPMRRLIGKGDSETNTVDPATQFVWFEQPITAIEANRQQAQRDQAAAGEAKSPAEPRFTINPLATGFKATALTALIGRIPVNGSTPDPYRVKLLIGADNLAANGIFFDGVRGMLVGGWAKGDWNLSCVDVELDSYAFVFEDGTISAKASSSDGGGESLGYVSMPNGFPCVPGEFHTNAPSYLAQSSFLNALQVAGQAYADKQTSREDLPLGGQRSSVTGSTEKYVLGKVASGAVEESIDWIRERQQSSFDAVVTPPGMSLVVHFEQQIEINYDPNGRKVDHGQTTQLSGSFLD